VSQLPEAVRLFAPKFKGTEAVKAPFLRTVLLAQPLLALKRVPLISPGRFKFTLPEIVATIFIGSTVRLSRSNTKLFAKEGELTETFLSNSLPLNRTVKLLPAPPLKTPDLFLDSLFSLR